MFKQRAMSKMHHYANKGDLTVGPIRKHLVRLTLPMVTSLFAMISFQLVNTFYISRLGTTELAAISFTFPITYIIFSLFLGFGIATSSVVSRLLGEKKPEDVRRIISHSLIMVFITSAIVAGAGLLFFDPLFRLIGAETALIPLIRDYMHLYFLGTFFICLPLVINASLRAAGDAKTPAIIITSAALANAVIDPVLIFGLLGFPRLELQGAAISTLLTSFIATLAGLYIMQKRGMISLGAFINFSQFKNSMQRILVIALPAGITSGLPSIVNSVILSLLAKSGEAPVAAFGVASRVEAFCFIIMMALASGMAPIIGQNWGADKIDRVRETIKDAILFCIFWSVFVAIILGIFANSFADLFSSDPAVQKYIVLYFLIVPFTYALSNIVNGWASAFNAMGKPQYSAGMLFLKLIILLIPALYIGYTAAGAEGVFISIALVNILTGITFHIFGWKYATAR
ncbi:MAG: MATE family efflux transporter [Micavibrio aeruginosavorus]|uniref:MATE family efflux transporter n=1 Tax=Micavibrio aeruginosavorus TaxID=349221 RepID=A0A2W5FQK1_9BACT|nr:MAG: MATE family efflux transporter [Micavibrio aeruginosavorus]